MNTPLDPQVLQRAQTWLNGSFDAETKAQVQHLVDTDPTELTDAFYRDLEFGTGGLRGIMGVGTNRMNVYTVAMATQGLVNYVKKSFPNVPQISFAVACDSRNNSQKFAEITASVIAANGCKCYLFESMRPTPELSFAVRYLGCQSGVVITASHNPKEYNGYKAYWNDGAQLIEPHDKNVIDEVQKIKDIEDVKMSGNADLIVKIGENIDRMYLDEIKKLSLSPQAIKNQKDLKIVFTALHGTGIVFVPKLLKEVGFENVTVVEEQAISSGDFPTVKSPNPEEKAALQMAIDKAKEIGATLVMATDPDADRVGIAIRRDNGEYMLLNGNQTGSVLIYYLLKKWKENNLLTGKEYIVKTIVTSELLKDIAEKNGVECFDVLTGFKYIADIIAKNEGKKRFIGGGEESYGYLVDEFVRDKDAVSACLMISEMAAWAAEQGKTFIDILSDLYVEYGFYKEDLLSLTKKGKAGVEEIQQMMVDLRNHPPKEINGSKVVLIKDYKEQAAKNLTNNTTEKVDLPKSNVLQFFTEDSSKITARPSGTEPKIKFYFGVKGELKSKADFDKVDEILAKKIEGIITSMKLK
ncbi:MAG: phospho-sugar mutase [Bacteroidales bacterium]|jgi:phosphoglucomutase|nr:phospho-sugar mutase [Bacteroidales bacterium]